MTTQRTSKKELKVAHAIPQEQLPPISISLKELFTERDRYTVRPKYQREKVWNLRQNQQYIDSLLLGDPSPPFEGYEGFEGHGMKMWEISDGQNRMHAIISFMNDEFKTWTAREKMAYEPNSELGPVQPGKSFSELDMIPKNYLYDYRIRIDRLRDRSETERATRFLRVQNHVPLTAAEKLRVYTSKAKETAECIAQHPFWEDFYEGRTNRGQIFQSSLYLLALEMSPNGIADLQSGGFIHNLVSGKRDNDIPDTLVDAVHTRLDIVSHLYYGAHFTIRATIIAMYQSVMFLEQTGYDVQPKDKGRLTSWINTLLAESTRASGIPAYNRPIQRLTSRKNQSAFWDKHLKTVMVLFGRKKGQASPSRDMMSDEGVRQEYDRIMETAMPSSL